MAAEETRLGTDRAACYKYIFNSFPDAFLEAYYMRERSHIRGDATYLVPTIMCPVQCPRLQDVLGSTVDIAASLPSSGAVELDVMCSTHSIDTDT
ncbi:hypothetical protein CERSUDRAFT_112170 [Gelatoporia subvermispora B]|uniref:Uncharacterized protein n=1 Tax=Ceriporiopsis subvermispora (strain B) TaxID=914234 RepID=M2RNC8_CERS8|nr:hypothetical protein CERSUDRAFT_112170 [Gelatoporia subvermispora B]